MGKSTLLNALVGERMSVITAKPQTTRHRIIGIVSGDDFQMVISDTPGFIEDPAYKMHHLMNAYINTSFDDADVILFVTDPFEPLEDQHALLRRIASHPAPALAVINKSDLATDEQLEARKAVIQQFLPERAIYVISAVAGLGVEALMKQIISLLPEGPAYYPKDQLTDRPERFFVSEIIRGAILEHYHEEVPYTTEVQIESFKEGESKSGPITRISAMIYTMDDRRKAILLGKNGSAIKQVGISARKEIERFLGTRVFLELQVKVRKDWRDDDRALTAFGYKY